MANHIYVAPCFNTPFSSLEDAKWNLQIGLTRAEARKYLTPNDHLEITHFIGNKLHSVTPILVDESGIITFGKTRLV